MIHRDIKSSNILIDEAGHARIADFGLALRTGDRWGEAAAFYETPPADDQQMLFGTYGYSSPEHDSSGEVSPGDRSWKAQMSVFEGT